MRSQALDRASRRIVWIRFAGLGVVLLLAGRAAHLTVAHTRARTLYDQQIQTEQRLSASRGTIFDRNGRELAITTDAASVYVMPRLMEDRAATASALSKALNLDLEHLAHRLANRDGFTYIERWVEPEEAARIKALDLPGVGLDQEARRSYPAGVLAAPLLGFANIDGLGVRGIEQLENEWLTGQPRRVRVERDARGRALALRSTDPREVQGGDVALTLDSAMQGAAEAALAAAVEKTQAVGGMVITMDPRNGDVLAIAEAPGFDPNGFRHLDYQETRSRAFADSVEAGSTMKAFLVASALDGLLVDPEQTFDTEEGWIRVRGKTIRDRRPFGILTPGDVLRVSSNVGAVQIAQAMGREAQHQGLQRFGFGTRTRSRFPVESSGILRDWRKWQPVDQAAISYGQGISITGIQLVSALAALANDGMRMEPRLVLARRQTGGAWQTTEVRRHGRAVSANAARLTLDMMQTVVSGEGTGRLAGLRGVRVAGKTGTAQKLDREAGRYSQDRYMAWFMGVVPADDPELAIIVAIDEPSGPSHSGGGIAAPLFARVAAAQLAHRGIITEPEPIAAAPLPVRIVERKSTPEIQLTQRDEPLPAVSAAHPTQRAAVKKRTNTTAASVGSQKRTNTTAASRGCSGPPGRSRRTSCGGTFTLHARRPSRPRNAPHLQAESRFALGSYSSLISGDEAWPARAASPTASYSNSQPSEPSKAGWVSQFPVPGTVLEGGDRTVRLRFEPRSDQRSAAPRRREES